MKFFSVILFVLVGSSCLLAQTQDEKIIRQIYDKALKEGKSYAMLEHLTKKIGARLSGSDGAAKAVEWTNKIMKEYGFDTVYLQPVMVPHWVRGKKEVGNVITGPKKADRIAVNICALGGSVGTGPAGVTGNIVEVKSFEELAKLGNEGVKGKIVFYNQPMDPTLINTFSAYGKAGFQRRSGASEAAKYGAIGVVVRSLGVNLEDYPHTGSMNYAENIPKIPAVAISTNHAEILSALLMENRDLKFYFQTNCETLPDAPSFNVIGELKGSEFPNEFIAVGGHLDSWDLAQGAHDDGTGCVQSIEALRILKAMGYKPKRTLHAVMFMNEENGLRGGQEYAKQAAAKNEKHIAAIESDRGGFTPRGFSMTGTDEAKNKIKSWKPLLEPYGLADFSQEGGGADIGPLAAQGTTLIGFLPDSQRYFSYHHTPEDTFDKVDKRELELGAAAMTALIYLIDQYGLK
ncbi:MAG TPA: M20/M25/M40 family metallo-hydrolase [Cyclobacteriaceae bacterium]|nr:M20/M25/M40 family metallo-hydrolase [Cyclobacteriaceae bacterium]